ncbi:hypothetical protein ACFY8K_36820 [Streptomyces misionensis]|uniref:hypothetical protein n=1 Tax=Streptomyces misionensis TaxID=67331 RepID=UPI00368F7436
MELPADQRGHPSGGPHLVLHSEALRLLGDHLFGPYALHRLELGTWSGNERAVRAFTRRGFREEGRRRAVMPVEGERSDRVLLGMLREEWASRGRAKGASAGVPVGASAG